MFFRVIIILALALGFYACRNFKSSSKGKQFSAENHVQSSAEIEFKNYYFEGVREKTLGNLEAAIKNFNKCLQIDPKSAPANYELAQLYNVLNRVPEAILFAKKAYELEPANEWYAQIYAQSLQRKQQYSEASKVFEKNAKLNNNKPQILYNWAGALLLEGNYKEALKVYELLEKENGFNEEVIEQKQRIYLKLGNLEKAAEEIKKLIELNPHEPRYLRLLADLYNINGQSQKSLEYFEKILEIDPDNGYVHLSLADLYKTKGDIERSQLELKKAFANSQVDIDSKMRILIAYFEASEKDENAKSFAYELIGLVLTTHPNDAKGYSIQGDFLYRDKKIYEARESFKKAIELDKSRFVLWNQLLLLDSELNDYEDMYLHGKQSIELFPNQPNLYLFTGVACMQKKLHNEAIENFKKGLDLVFDNNPLKAQFYSYLGDSYHAIKDYENSDKSYENALKLDPQNVYVLNNYAYYLSLRNEKLERAEEMSRKTLSLEPNKANYEDTYAWILFKMGRYEDARYWLERAIENGGGGNATILEHLGDTYYKLDNISRALELWEKAAQKSDSELLKKKIRDKKLYE